MRIPAVRQDSSHAAVAAAGEELVRSRVGAEPSMISLQMEPRRTFISAAAGGKLTGADLICVCPGPC